MTDSNDDRAMTLSSDDEQVFQRLDEAQQQYEQYLAVIQSAAVFVPIESLVMPPSQDLPLSLTIWNDKTNAISAPIHATTLLSARV